MRTNALTAQIAREWNETRSLEDYNSIDVDAAAILAGYDDADLELDGLTEISVPVAKALAQHKKGLITLRGLTIISDDVAEALSSYSGFLDLSGLTSISVAAARSLTKSAQHLNLDGLTQIPDPVADVLAAFNGDLRLRGISSLTNLKLAVKLAEEPKELDLPTLTEISDDAAAILSRSKAMLLLPSLAPISNFDLAWKLFTQNKDSSCLDGLTLLSPAEASIIANYKGNVYLDNIAELSEIAAEAISRHKGVLGLRGLSLLSDSAADALSKHDGILILPQTLSKRVADHFLSRFTSGNGEASQTPISGGAIRAIALEHGKLYDCKIVPDDGQEEDANILQLAIDATSNRRYVLLNARNVFKNDPEFVRRIVNLDFYFLFVGEFDHAKWPDLIIEVCLNEKGTALETSSGDLILFGFRETS
jgi:hypothetical protein